MQVKADTDTCIIKYGSSLSEIYKYNSSEKRPALNVKNWKP